MAENASAKSAKGSNNMMIIGIVVVVVIIAAAALLLYHPSASTGGNGGTGGGGGGGSGGTLGGGGAGASYMSQSQMSQMMGPGGNYNSSGEITGAQLASALALYGGSNSSSFGILTNNVTAMWASQYANNATHMSMVNLVFQTPNAAALYAKMIKNFSTNSSSSGAFNVTAKLNQTSDGLTYSYVSTPFLNLTTLVGYKNNELAWTLTIGKRIDGPTLAATMAADMP